MSALGGIPVHIERRAVPPESGTIGGGLAALLAEIATRLEHLAATGEPAAIDLLGLPMNLQDRSRLSETLGPGEVEIVLTAGGESRIRETGVQGVWWIEHRDRDGALIASLIEIAPVPEILIVPVEELARGAGRLREATRATRRLQAESRHGIT